MGINHSNETRALVSLVNHTAAGIGLDREFRWMVRGVEEWPFFHLDLLETVRWMDGGREVASLKVSTDGRDIEFRHGDQWVCLSDGHLQVQGSEVSAITMVLFKFVRRTRATSIRIVNTHGVYAEAIPASWARTRVWRKLVRFSELSTAQVAAGMAHYDAKQS
jgi:hypothetical protein